MKKPGYKVCILAAGVGSRMGKLSEHINKGILPVNNKAVISYMIEKFPKEVEFVVAVGHKKETVIDYLTLAYPDRKFKFVDVKNYIGPGSGPGVSMLACKPYLQCPFIFSTADTIVVEDIPEPDENWIGIAPVHDTEPYCTVKMRNNSVYQLDIKMKTDNHFAFIGLAGIKDFKTFFHELETNKELVKQEAQVITGLNALIEKRLVPIGFTWFDTGTLENYTETNKNFSGENKFDFSKGNEFLYFVNNRVIKFFADSSISEKRHLRAEKGLKGLTPKIEARRGNFYSYRMVEGQTLYSALNTQVTAEFLDWANKYLWKKLKLTKAQEKTFKDSIVKFYQDKTKERVSHYIEKIGGKEKTEIVNGVRIPKVTDLLKKIDWSYLTEGIPANFHGDLQFDNILVKTNASNLKDKFILLDWRHDFGGQVDVGDLYYDLAKLYGGMILSYPLIKERMFSFDTNKNEAYYHYFIKSDLLDAREHYEDFIRKEGYDLKKIKLLTAIIFLNMAPLHNEPFDGMLYHMGRRMLHRELA